MYDEGREGGGYGGVAPVPLLSSHMQPSLVKRTVRHDHHMCDHLLWPVSSWDKDTHEQRTHIDCLVHSINKCACSLWFKLPALGCPGCWH